MGCYFCWNKNKLKIDDNGNCQVCSKAACAPPPVRPDGRFHGDACSLVSCGQFLCLPHMHRHPHSDEGVSATFPRATVVMATSAVNGLRRLAEPGATSRSSGAEPDPVQPIEAYLNCITPGTTALLQMRESLPDNATRIETIDDDQWMTFDRSFFRRSVSKMVGHLALRSLWVAGYALGLPEDPMTFLAFASWSEHLERPDMRERSVKDIDISWLGNVLHELPVQLAIDQDEMARLPDEADSIVLVQALASRYDEGEAVVAMTARG